VKDRCPGGDLRNLTVADVRCEKCARKVELFSDEQRRRCPHCGEWVARVSVPTCASWCPSAKMCLGEERFAELAESGHLGNPAKEPAEE